MNHFKLFPIFILFLVLFMLVACGQTAKATTPTTALLATLPTLPEPVLESAAASPRAAGKIDCASRGETVDISDARLYVEFNATDGDLGVHGGFDDHGWSELCVYAPSGEQILAVKPQAQLGDLTMASIFFESREPELSEFSFDKLVAKFPEGQYEVRASSYDGAILTGAATFSHNVPAEPFIISPLLAEDEETAVDALVSTTNLVVTWEDVTETVDGDPLALSGYELIITKVDHDDPHGFSRPVYDVHLPPDRNSLSVPTEFLEADTVYELEILTLEESATRPFPSAFSERNEFSMRRRN